MDLVSATTSFSRGASASRDHSAPRRAYLDTYAKRRAGISEVQPQEPVVQATVSTKELTQSPEPITSQAQIQTVNAYEYMQPQPSVDSFSYQPTAQPSSQAQEEVVEVSTHRSYLDTLTKRHQQAVQASSVAEEAVISPTLSTETQFLLDDPLNETRLEANLRALYSDPLANVATANSDSASTAHIRTIAASALACGVMAVGIFTFMGRYNAQPVIAQPIGSPVIEVEASAAAPKNAPAVVTDNSIVAADPEHPVRVVISSIGVNAPVEGLGTTPEGLIAVPKAYGVVGWYNKGSVPGKAGPAVLVGHYAGGNGAVFDKLGDLNNGDLITTTNGKGQSFTYRVVAKNEYAKEQVPMAQIFKSSKESRLEIITCAGKWQAKTYNNRLVISAELVK